MKYLANVQQKNGIDGILYNYFVKTPYFNNRTTDVMKELKEPTPLD